MIIPGNQVIGMESNGGGADPPPNRNVNLHSIAVTSPVRVKKKLSAIYPKKRVKK